MGTTQSLSEFNERVLNDHAQIFSTLVHASRTVDALEPTDPDPHLFAQAWAQIELLEAQLTSHFRAEEASQMQDRLTSLLPEAAPEIARLRAEHVEILTLLTRMREGDRRCTPLTVQRLADDVSLLLELMYTHEAAEDRLISVAVSTEEAHAGGRL